MAGIGWLCFTACMSPPPSSTRPRMSCRTPRPIVSAGQGWWPTKSPASTKGYVGSSVCAECHSAIASTQAESEMAKAAFRLSGGAAGQPSSGDFESGPYTYRFIPNTTASGYSLEVTSDGHSISAPITWTMGSGVHGQTYLLNENGGMYESQVSSFSFIHRMGLSPGHTPRRRARLRMRLAFRSRPVKLCVVSLAIRRHLRRILR